MTSWRRDASEGLTVRRLPCIRTTPSARTLATICPLHADFLQGNQMALERWSCRRVPHVPIDGAGASAEVLSPLVFIVIFRSIWNADVVS